MWWKRNRIAFMPYVKLFFLFGRFLWSQLRIFLKVDLRVAEVKHAEPHPNADKLLILKIDAGRRFRK